MRRHRRKPPIGEFVDPLSNYDPPAYEDALEESVMHDRISSMQITPFDTVRPSASIEQAVKRMGELEVACLMVTDDSGKLVGIFSERDVLNRVADHWDACRRDAVATVMTRDPVVAYETDSPAKAINLMAVGGFRHVPILDVDDRVVGILGPRRVTKYLTRYID
jgi:CBS domain-containing protein